MNAVGCIAAHILQIDPCRAHKVFVGRFRPVEQARDDGVDGWSER